MNPSVFSTSTARGQTAWWTGPSRSARSALASKRRIDGGECEVLEGPGNFPFSVAGPGAPPLGGRTLLIRGPCATPNVLGTPPLRGTRPAQAPPLPGQTGSANFAVELLNLPWRQRFEGSGGRPKVMGSGAFVPFVAVAARVQAPALQALGKQVGL